MKVQIPDYVVKSMLKSSRLPTDVLIAAASVDGVVNGEATAHFLLIDGRERFDGEGITVLGKRDSTGKFFKVSQIRIDRDSKD